MGGYEALHHTLAEWQRMWLKPSEPLADPASANSGIEVDADVELPRPTLEEVRAALKQFPRATGLGIDCLNPRTYLQLPDEMLELLLDILLDWEATPTPLKAWASLIVFLPKPTGGSRPIGLLVGILRLWGKLRRPHPSAMGGRQPYPAVLGWH